MRYNKNLNRIKSIINIFCWASIIIGCINNNSIQPKKVEISPSGSKSTYSDSSLFFGDIIGIAANDSIIIMNDTEFEKAIVFNSKLNFENSVGIAGKGPGEIGNLGVTGVNPIIKKNKVYLYDMMHNNIKVFELGGKYKKTIEYPLKEKTDYILFNYAMDSKGNFYTSNSFTNKPIIKFNQKGNIIDQFGKFIPGDNKKHKRAINYRHLVSTSDNKIICVYKSKPQIEIYTRRGKRLNTYKYDNYFNFFNKRLERKIRENPQKKFVAHNLFRDTYFYENKLYLLFWGDYEEHPYSNQIAVFNLKDNNIHFEKVINLKTKNGESSFSSFCVINNKILAYESLAGELLIYKI